MNFDIQLQFRPSNAFLSILAELNGQHPQLKSDAYDWANQTEDFLAEPVTPPEFDPAMLETPLSRRALEDTRKITFALLTGDYPQVRDYLRDIHFALVIGYPRSGGSYLTKELLRTIGLEHTQVSEALAHDGFPDLRETWYDWDGNQPYYHLEQSISQVAEFLVTARLYYQRRTERRTRGAWLVPKKMHKVVAWASSFKMLLGQGHADYLVTVRHPVSTAISIYEKCGGLPANGLFPMTAPRSAMERWIILDLMHLGYTVQEIARMPYVDAVIANWSQFHLRMANSGLFLVDREEIRMIPYGKPSLEQVVRDYRARLGKHDDPEPVHIHDKAMAHPDWLARGDEAVRTVAHAWDALGLRFPDVSPH